MAKDQFGHPTVEPASSALPDIPIDLVNRRILSKVRNHGLAPGAQYPIHFVQSPDRLREIFKGSRAVDKIKRIVRKGHRGRVPVSKVDFEVCVSDVLCCKLDECPTDIQTGDPEISQLSQFHGEEPRPRRDLQHITAALQT